MKWKMQKYHLVSVEKLKERFDARHRPKTGPDGAPVKREPGTYLDPFSGETKCPHGWVGVSLKLEDKTATARLVIRAAGEKKKPVTLKVTLRGPHDGNIRTLVKIPLGATGVALEAPGLIDGHMETLPKERIGQLLGGAKFREWVKKPGSAKKYIQTASSLLYRRRFRELKSSLKEQLFHGEVDVRTPYAIWIENFRTITDEERKRIRRELRTIGYAPKISILMPVYNTDEKWLRRAIESVRAQLYTNWELCIADDCSSLPHVRRVLDEYEKIDFRIKVTYRKSNGHISAASNTAMEKATGEFLALLDHDDEFTEDALYQVVRTLGQNRDLDLIYSDEDKIDAFGRLYDPHFKSDWNVDLFYSLNLITHLAVIRASLVKKVGGFRSGFDGSQDYDLFLRVIEQTTPDKIFHIPLVLYHWRTIPGSTAIGPEGKSYAVTSARRALTEHFKRTKILADVVEGVEAFHRVVYKLPKKLPLVSAIVCTRDRVDLLEGVISGLLEQTDYPRLEVIVVDNASELKETKAYLAKISKDPRVRILAFPGPFNFSAMNNAAARDARGDILAFLNNDLEVIEPGWLTEMVRFAVQPAIGAVGARLLYPDGKIQHAGIVLGMGGVAGHPHKGFGRHEMGYVGRAKVIQSVSGVTAACMLMRKGVFENVGGFDERDLPVAFNDVDLCLKVRRAGFRIVWTPFAELYHLESASRGSDETAERLEKFLRENQVMEDRWGRDLRRDPFYNPNLTLNRGDFNLALPPRDLEV